LFDIASKTLNVQADETSTSVDTRFGRVSINADKRDGESGLLIKTNSEEFFMPGMTVDSLLSKARKTVANHADWYDSSEVLECIKNRVSEDESSNLTQEAAPLNAEEELGKMIDTSSKLAKQEAHFSQLGWRGNLKYGKLTFPTEANPGYKKDQPYRSTEIKPRNLNGQAVFTPVTVDDTIDNPIVCRHLATQYIKDILQDPSGKGKVRWESYSSKTAIAEHVPIETKVASNNLAYNAKRCDLISNDKFGQHLKACFEDMRKPEKKETLRTLLINSTNHAMAVRLCIKDNTEGEGKPVYVVNFYDPNITNGSVRCETNDLSTLINQTLKQYVDGSNEEHAVSNYALYSGENAPISMVMECDLANFTNYSTNTERRLNSFAADPLTPTHIFTLLDGYFFHNFVGLQNQLQEIGQQSPEQLLHLLSGTNESGMSGLFIALGMGHKAAIKTYTVLLKGLFSRLAKFEQKKLIELLAVKDLDGIFALNYTPDYKYVETVDAYQELLHQLPETERAELTASIDYTRYS